MKQEAEKRTAGKMGKKKYAVDKTAKQVLLREVCDRDGTEQLQIYNDRR